MENWTNDSIHHCNTCDTTFKVYVKDNEPSVDFCPCCGSSNIDNEDEED